MSLVGGAGQQPGPADPAPSEGWPALTDQGGLQGPGEPAGVAPDELPRGEYDWIVMDPDIDFAGRQSQFDTFEFTTADGHAARFATDVVGLAPREVADNLDVLHNPADSKNAAVRGAERAAACLLGIGGVVVMIVGILMALAALDRILP